MLEQARVLAQEQVMAHECDDHHLNPYQSGHDVRKGLDLGMELEQVQGQVQAQVLVQELGMDLGKVL